MKKFSSLATFIVLIAFACVFSAYAYDAFSKCQRTIIIKTSPSGGSYPWPANTARARANNSGLENGSINVYAHAGGTPRSRATSYGTSPISWSVYDEGPWGSSGSSNAYVDGYDPTGAYQSDHHPHSN